MPNFRVSEGHHPTKTRCCCCFPSSGGAQTTCPTHNSFLAPVTATPRISPLQNDLLSESVGFSITWACDKLCKTCWHRWQKWPAVFSQNMFLPRLLPKYLDPSSYCDPLLLNQKCWMLVWEGVVPRQHKQWRSRWSSTKFPQAWHHKRSKWYATNSTNSTISMK